jgi:hypothetical protein
MDLSSNDNVCRQGIANMKLYKPMVDRVERRQRVRAVWAPPEVMAGGSGEEEKGHVAPDNKGLTSV